MTLIGWTQIIIYCAIVVALVKPLGGYMTRVFNGEHTFLSPVLKPVETTLYGFGHVDERREQHWLACGKSSTRTSRAAPWVSSASPGSTFSRSISPWIVLQPNSPEMARRAAA